MPTRNIVPNSDDSGKLGTPAKRWSEGHFSDAVRVGGLDVVTEAPSDGRNYVRNQGDWQELQSEGYVLTPVTTNNTTTAFLSFGEVAPLPLVPGRMMIFEANVTATNQFDGSSAAWTINGTLKRAFDGVLSVSSDQPTEIVSDYWSSGLTINAAVDTDSSLVKLAVRGLQTTQILWQGSVSVVFSQVATSSLINFGCTDNACENYSALAEADNGTCIYPSQQTSNMFVTVSVNAATISSLSVVLNNQKTPLSPAFNPEVQDYYIQASTDDWTNVFYSITVNNGAVISGNTLVNKVLRIRTSNDGAIYYVRILPAPLNIATVTQTPLPGYVPGYYLTTGDIFGTSGAQYCSVYDQTGKPVWYTQTDVPLNWSLEPGKEPNKLLSLAASNRNNYSLKLKYRELGSTAPILLKPNTRDGIEFRVDPHEIIEVKTPYTRNGNLILAAYCPEADYGGFYIQEQSPAGDIVWEWFSADYFDATLHPPAALIFRKNGMPYNEPEAYHLNSIDVDPRTGNLLVSLRPCSGVICIEYSTGNVLWGFGGSVVASNGGFPIQAMAIPSATVNTKWLTFVNEPTYTTTLAPGVNVDTQYRGVAAQHDVRWRDDIIEPLTAGNHVISLYDNQSPDQAPQLVYTGNSSNPAGPPVVPGTATQIPTTTTVTPRSRACVYEIDLVNNRIIHRSSIFSNAPWSTYRKSPFMGSYKIFKDVDVDGVVKYTHSVNFTGERPPLKEYIGPIDGPKTPVFSMDLPGVLYRIIKVPLSFLKRENLRAAWTSVTAPPTVPVQQPFTPQPLEKDIKAYWPLSTNAWNDATGNGFTLTPEGTVTNGTGVMGATAVFDGLSHLYNNAFTLTAGQSFSLSMFFKITQYANRHSFLYAGKNVGDLFLGFQEQEGIIGFGRNEVSWDGTYAFTPQIGTWYHVSLVYSGSNMSLFLNGEKVIDQDTEVEYVNTSGLYLGTGGAGANQNLFPIYAEIKSAAFWNRALRNYEVGMLYSGGNSLPYPFIPTDGLRLWLDAADSSSIETTSGGTDLTVWRDKSGNGKNAIPLPGSTPPSLETSTASLGNKRSVAFNNAPGNSQILVTDPIYSVGYTQLSAATIIGVASASSNTAAVSGDPGCRWVDLIASTLQSSIGLSVKRLGGSAKSFGGYISQSFIAEKPLQNYATLADALLVTQQVLQGQTPTKFPTELTATPTGIVSILLNTGGVGSPIFTPQVLTAIRATNSQFISSFLANGVIKSVVGNNVTFYGQIVDQPTNNGVTIGASIVAGNTVGLRSTLNVSEVLIYDKALNDVEIGIVVAYLRGKYSI
jgi:hypothetical protein